MNTIAKYITPVVIQRLQTANKPDWEEKGTKDKPVSVSETKSLTVSRVPLTNPPAGLYSMGA